MQLHIAFNSRKKKNLLGTLFFFFEFGLLQKEVAQKLSQTGRSIAVFSALTGVTVALSNFNHSYRTSEDVSMLSLWRNSVSQRSVKSVSNRAKWNK